MVVSTTPTLFSVRGAKKTRVPTAAAPWYLVSEVTPAVMLMVENVSVAVSTTPTLFSV